MWFSGEFFIISENLCIGEALFWNLDFRGVKIIFRLQGWGKRGFSGGREVWC